MANSIKLTFAGDADSLAKAAKQSEQALGGVEAAADRSGDQLANAAEKNGRMVAGLGSLGAATSGATDALDSFSGGMQAVVDIQQAGAERASRLARALLDVEQAQEDANQAVRDFAQAGIDADQAALDLEQANLDAATALKEYNTAVKEHGKGSAEARQAAIDLKQANIDAKQANEDAAQATRDAAQANIDAREAQLNLNDANREARPPELQKWVDNLALITPLLTAVVGVVGLVTAAQWLWNASLFASPVTWIVLGIAALIAAIVLIATKTTWFQDLWKWAWGGIKSAASSAWDFIKKIPGWVGDAFSKIGNAISAPFKAGFNAAAKAWNNTIGRLSWTVPGWVPGLAGNTISAPQLPTFHTGGTVPGSLGQEVLAVLQAGETVTPAGGGGRSIGPDDLRMPSGAGLDAMFLTWLAGVLRRNNLRLVAG